MKITVKEAYDLATKNLRSYVLDKIMNEINIACKNGQFTTSIHFDNLTSVRDIIINTLHELGYTVLIRKDRYTGTLKYRTTITINWKND